jgi:hypothetical protein
MLQTDRRKMHFALARHVDRRAFLGATAAVAGSLGLLPDSWTMAAANRPQIRIDPIRSITTNQGKFLEPWIAAHPRDSSNLVVFASRYLGKGPTALHREPVAWTTADGGATWLAGEFAGLAQLRGERSSFGNAHAGFAPDGTAFCVYTGSPTGDRLDLWVFRSDNGGRRWLGPTAIPGGLDYPRLTATLNAGKPRVFVTAGVDGLVLNQAYSLHLAG